MRLITFQASDGPRLGVVIGSSVVDAQHILGTSTPIRDVQELVASADATSLISRLASSDEKQRYPSIPLEDVVVLPPVLQPPTVRDHIAFEEHASRQFTRAVADVWRRRPIHYYSNPSRLVGTGGPVVMPATERLDYELEIAAIIGVECSDVPEDEGLQKIFGFTILNDWSARDLQADERPGNLGPCKGKDFATSLGPWVVTVDEMLPYLDGGRLDLDCQVRVNGQVWGTSNSRSQYHTWGSMIAHASQDSRLLPGDVIASGTVSGCSIGEAIRKGFPAHYLRPGDSVELDVEALGVLSNTIAANPRSTPARYSAHELPPMPVALTNEEARA